MCWLSLCVEAMSKCVGVGGWGGGCGCGRVPGSDSVAATQYEAGCVSWD